MIKGKSGEIKGRDIKRELAPPFVLVITTINMNKEGLKGVIMNIPARHL